MTKGKNLNPADAYRKAQRKKELKKNKAERHKARDLALVKKDTTELEEEIQSLEEKNGPSAADKSRLAGLKAELEKISMKKEEYVQEHPEQRGLVYRRKKTEEEKAREKTIPEHRNVFNKKGLPRHPERSIYYDPVMNPYGVPPPGMPYMERPPLPGDVDSDQDGSQDDIAMPQGPPPDPNEEFVNSDDDIPLPGGPPPCQEVPVPPISASSQLTLGWTSAFPPPPITPSNTSPPSFPPGAGIPLPPPPPGFPSAIPLPLAHPGFSIPGYPHALPNFPPTGAPSLPLPAPPPGFFPHRNQSVASMRDPLSSVPHTTYQAHHATRASLPLHPSLPAKPVATVTAPSATVFAEPQLRDLKKEATEFVPAALKRKRPIAQVPSMKVNAAPTLGEVEGQESIEPKPARPDLVSILRHQFGPPPVPDAKSLGKRKDDYEKFVDEMGDILG